MKKARRRWWSKEEEEVELYRHSAVVDSLKD
jgi:hypothetical protein